MRGRVWLLSALAAVAVIYGVAELRSGKGHETEAAQAGLETSVPGQGTGAPDENQKPQAASAQEPKPGKEAPWSIQVMDVKDSVEVGIPAGWPDSQDREAMRSALREKAAGIAAKWDRQPVDSQMESFNKETGNYQYSEGVNGRSLNQDKLVQDLMEAVEGNNRQARIQAEFSTIAPRRGQAQAKEQYKVIGSFSTTTTDNKNRNENIRLAVEAIDGTVLRPGEEFSFNMTTGNRTRDKGYQPAGAYRNGVLIEEPGGGVCQVSTTLYHAILNSGFKATERNAHSYAPGYINKGQDAMVSFDGYAGPDLKFVNTGDASVGLRASFQGNKLKLSIVGLPVLEDGKDVSLRSEKVKDVEPPAPVYEENPELAYGEEKVMEEAQPGSVWKTYRQLLKDGKVVEEMMLNTSTYKAKPARIQRNSAALPPQEALEGGLDGSGQEGSGQDVVPQDGSGQIPGAGLSGGNAPEGSAPGTMAPGQ